MYCAIDENAGKPIVLSEFGWAQGNPDQFDTRDDRSPLWVMMRAATLAQWLA